MAVADVMKVHRVDASGTKVEWDKRQLVATLISFRCVQKLSADKQTRVKQAAGM